jgi:hypothetical protein
MEQHQKSIDDPIAAKLRDIAALEKSDVTSHLQSRRESTQTRFSKDAVCARRRD